MIDIVNEEVLSLTDAAKRLPHRRKGARPNVATLYRWATHGVRGVRLETICVGATRCTSVEALQRFCEAVTAATDADAPAVAPSPRRTRQREREIAAAEKRVAEVLK